jgi:outer membrane biogenesis lipoprotein LolB
MSNRSIRQVRLSAALAKLTYTSLACFLLAACASVGSQPPTYVEDAPKAKVQPCQGQSQSTQGKTATDPCQKSGSQ